MKIIQKKIGIEKLVDDFLNQVSQAGIIFKQGANFYLTNNISDFLNKGIKSVVS